MDESGERAISEEQLAREQTLVNEVMSSFDEAGDPRLKFLMQ